MIEARKGYLLLLPVLFDCSISGLVKNFWFQIAKKIFHLKAPKSTSNLLENPPSLQRAHRNLKFLLNFFFCRPRWPPASLNRRRDGKSAFNSLALYDSVVDLDLFIPDPVPNKKIKNTVFISVCFS